MGRITSKLQVTVPKAIADAFGLRPGDEIEWEAAGDVIRVRPPLKRSSDTATRLRVFDQATARQRRREARMPRRAGVRDRGWSREDLYERGRAR